MDATALRLLKIYQLGNPDKGSPETGEEGY